MSEETKEGQALRQLDERLLELTALFEISRSITSSLSIRAILENTLRIPMGHMLISRGLVLLKRTKETEYFVEEVKGLPGNTVGMALCINHPPSRPVFTKNARGDCNWTPFFAKHEIDLILPLNSTQGVIGLLGFGKKIGGKEFSGAEVEFLNSISNIAATAVANGLMVDEIRSVNRNLDRKIQHLNTIFDISRELNTTLDQRKIGSLLSFAVMGELLVNKCLIFTKGNPYDEALVAKGVDPLIQEDPQLYEIAEPLILDQTERFDYYRDLGIAVLVPMRMQDETRGILAIGPKISNMEFDDSDLEFLKTLGNQAMTSLENARLFEETLEKQRMEEELNLARNLQQGLLPATIPQLPNMELAGLNIPSRQVGGDYYDVIKINDTLYGIAIADVAGKGAGAALLMSNLQATMHALISVDVDIESMVAKINNIIHRNTPLDKFITFFYGLFDLETREFTFCNAGHNPPYRVNRAGEIDDLMAGGIVLGMMENIPFETGKITIDPGDRIVMYTDGITEAMDQQDEEYGEERLKALIQQTPDLSAQDLLKKLVDDVMAFSKGMPQADDITMVVMKGL